jgi:hypothetical protein
LLETELPCFASTHLFLEVLEGHIDGNAKEQGGYGFHLKRLIGLPKLLNLFVFSEYAWVIHPEHLCEV